MQVEISLGGETIVADESTWMQEADKLHAKHGGVPAVKYLPPPVGAPVDLPPPVELSTPAPIVSEPVSLLQRAPSAGLRAVQSPPFVRGETVVASGKARSQRDFDAAVAAGFTPAKTLYERGTAVIDLGVENARRARLEFDAMPTTTETCADLARVVLSENRRDIEREYASITFDAKTCEAQIPDPHTMSPRAFMGFVQRVGIGGAQYLEKCWPELRAHNLNSWMEKYVAEEDAAFGNQPEKLSKLNFRTRDAGEGKRSVFSVVTPTYTPFDANEFADVVRQAVPEGARGRMSYDGERTRIECLFHSTVQPEDYVAGEFFRAGVIVTTDDTGGGSIRGSAVVWQNLCLNLIIIDEAHAGSFSIRHVSDKDKLVEEFRKGFAKSAKAIEHFRQAWGYSVHDEVLAQAKKMHGDTTPDDMRELMAWAFRGLIVDDRVPVLARGNRVEESVQGLMKAWDSDRSAAAGPNRAGIVNAITRYAHESGSFDPWQEDQIQRAAGALVFSRRPIPLAAPEVK